MENDNRIAELLAGALIRLDQMVGEQKITNDSLENVNNRLGHVEGELQKLNLQTVENTRAIFKLADKVDQNC